MMANDSGHPERDGLNRGGSGAMRLSVVRGAAASVLLVVSVGSGSVSADEAAARHSIEACRQDSPEVCSDAYFNRCAEAGNWTTQAMVACNDDLAAYWDSVLNATYREAMAGLSHATKTDLRAAQRAWIAWRDARCGFYRHFDGTMWRPVAAGCVASMTRERVADLVEVRDMLP